MARAPRRWESCAGATAEPRPGLQCRCRRVQGALGPAVWAEGRWVTAILAPGQRFIYAIPVQLSLADSVEGTQNALCFLTVCSLASAFS